MSEICTLIESTNPLLRIKLSECSSDLDREKVESQLIDSMKHYQGIGLSANQVGIMERVFVMYSDVKKGEIISCFNPKIITQSDTEIVIEEGCLSYPGLWLKVKRPDGIEVEYEDKTGEVQSKAMFGLECRIFLHEYDHMEGTDFTKKVSKIKLDRAKKRQSKMLKKSKLLKNQ
jgi:peptide deformylase|tara:strand:+ start:1609 stop:2130 length:522 start_codon:yes stop_codon:yes gene_type:complete